MFVGDAIVILLPLVIPSDAERMKKFWEAEEARLAKEEAELDRMEREFGMLASYSELSSL